MRKFDYESIPSNFKSDLEYDDLEYIDKKDKVLVKILHILVVAFVIIAITTVGYVSFSKSYTSDLSFKSNKNDISSVLSFKISNEYGELTMDNFPYSYLSNSFLAEVYKSNKISITSLDDNCQYDYIINGIDDDSFGVTTGEIIFEPRITGQYNLILNENCENKSNKINIIIYAKYIRRELKKLTDNDRNNFLSAMHKLWTINTEDGKQIYGENYKSAQYFAILHNDATGSPVCDEFHSGSGFINNHILLNSYFEQSLQLIDPTTCLHYWEYVKDFSDNYEQHQINQLDGGQWTEIMTDKYFGSNDPITGEILDSLWKGFTLPTLTDDELLKHGVDIENTFFPEDETKWLSVYNKKHIHSPYGLLRSAQNYNPFNKLTRYNNINRIKDFTIVDSDISSTLSGVNCNNYQSFLSLITNQSFEFFLSNFETYIHGNVHPTIGGSGGDNAYSIDQYLVNTYNLDTNDLITLSTKGHFFKKYITMQLNNQIDYSNDPTFPLLCNGMPWNDEEGKLNDQQDITPSCYCNPLMLDNPTGIKKFLLLLHIDSTNGLYDKIYSLSIDQQKDLLNQFCSKLQYDGELSGASAIDPIFWIIHGPIEKLYQKIIFNNYLSDYIYKDSKESCSGHKEDSVKTWTKGFYFEDTSILVEELTNKEITSILDPRSDEYGKYINYVYDHSQWNEICGIN